MDIRAAMKRVPKSRQKRMKERWLNFAERRGWITADDRVELEAVEDWADFIDKFLERLPALIEALTLLLGLFGLL